MQHVQSKRRVSAMAGVLGATVALAGVASCAVDTAPAAEPVAGSRAALVNTLVDPVAIQVETNMLGDTILYVLERNNHTIKKIVASGACTTSVLAGGDGVSGSADGTGTAARFSSPEDLAFDGTNLYVADTGNNTVRKVTTAGVVTTGAGLAGTPGWVAGTGSAARFRAVRDIFAQSSSNTMYVADSDGTNSLKRSVDKSTWAVTVGAALVGVAADVTPLYTLMSSRHVLLAQSFTNPPAGVLAGGDGVPGSADGTGAAARFNSPRRMVSTNPNSISSTHYVADTGNHSIRRVSASGVVTTLAGTSTLSGFLDGTGAAARFNNPMGIALHPSNGNIYVADTGNNAIRVVTTAGVVTTLHLGYPQCQWPTTTVNVPANKQVLFGNPYNRGTNALSVVLPSVPASSQVVTSTGTTYTFTAGAWSPNGNLVLRPGESFWFVNPTGSTTALTFTGDTLPTPPHTLVYHYSDAVNCPASGSHAAWCLYENVDNYVAPAHAGSGAVSSVMNFAFDNGYEVRQWVAASATWSIKTCTKVNAGDPCTWRVGSGSGGAVTTEPTLSSAEGFKIYFAD